MIVGAQSYDDVMIAVNCEGVFVIDNIKATTRAGGREEVLIRIPFTEFSSVGLASKNEDDEVRVGAQCAPRSLAPLNARMLRSLSSTSPK